ncbi:MAG: hypothetical protein R3Y09_07995 [Clostridia bacterium]
MKEIVKILPAELWCEICEKQNIIEEIRIREKQPISIRVCGKMQKIENISLNLQEIKQILAKAMEFSVHSYMNELKNGFITIKNGHRIGVCGEAVFDNDKITNFKKITSLNIRVAHKSINFETTFLNGIEDKNILIISPPNYGKTTLLREICRYLSRKSYNLSIIDERFEISPRCNLGENIDVLLGVPKFQGVWLMLKSMAPDYIVLDEITTDTMILNEISNCGVKIIATIHAKDILEIKQRKKEILSHFDVVIEIKIENNHRKYIIKDVK